MCKRIGSKSAERTATPRFTRVAYTHLPFERWRYSTTSDQVCASPDREALEMRQFAGSQIDGETLRCGTEVENQGA